MFRFRATDESGFPGVAATDGAGPHFYGSSIIKSLYRNGESKKNQTEGRYFVRNAHDERNDCKR
jgi:hypothetical protein